MPVEFSVAAFRFGHSMVRPSYALRRNDPSVGGGNSLESFTGYKRFHRIPIFSDRVESDVSLNGFGPLPDNWEIDWNLFFCAGDLPTVMTDSGPDQGSPTLLRCSAAAQNSVPTPSFTAQARRSTRLSSTADRKSAKMLPAVEFSLLVRMQRASALAP
jgi:hypothetical protein